jgi:phosphate starvation-inducible protein PhoH and related proteins
VTQSGPTARLREEHLAIPDHLSPFQVLGTGDQVLDALETALPGVDLSVRGHQITLRGEERQVAEGRRVVLALIGLALEGQVLTSDTVERVASVTADQRLDGRSPQTVLSEAVLTHRGASIRPKTLGQKEYLDAIRDNTVVFGIGPAGTGKTYLAVAMGVKALLNKEVNRIILTRPAVEAGERLGFLPGTLNEKIDPYLRPLYDSLHDMMDPDTISRLLGAGTIEVAPLAYMRGRTLNDAFVILDEAQNTTPEQMKMFLTRLGFNSTMVVTGDVTQTDLPGGAPSGLRVAAKVLESIEDIVMCRLTSRDVVRHQLVTEIVEAYGRWDAVQGKDSGRGHGGRPGGRNDR